MDVVAWWREMRTRCSPLNVREPIGGAEVEARLRAALGWVAPAERFVLPPRFHAYLDVLASTTWYGHHVALDFLLSAPRAIVERAEAEQPEDHEDHEVVREAGLWIAIGDVRDKHTYFLCCDRARPLCGHVVDAHDDHPWLNGTRSLSDLGTFEDWLADVQSYRSRRDDRGLLIALTPEERVELDPLLASADPWALVIAARDLEYKLTPDSAWQHALGAPERVLLASIAPPGLEELAIARYDDALVALVPSATIFETLRPYALGGWDERRKFSFIEDPRDRLRALAAPLLFVR